MLQYNKDLALFNLRETDEPSMTERLKVVTSIVNTAISAETQEHEHLGGQPQSPCPATVFWVTSVEPTVPGQRKDAGTPHQLLTPAELALQQVHHGKYHIRMAEHQANIATSETSIQTETGDQEFKSTT